MRLTLVVRTPSTVGWMGRTAPGPARRGGSALAVAAQAISGVMRPGLTLAGPFGGVDEVEGIDLRLDLGEAAGQGLVVEDRKQGLVNPFVLSLGG